MDNKNLTPVSSGAKRKKPEQKETAAQAEFLLDLPATSLTPTPSRKKDVKAAASTKPNRKDLAGVVISAMLEGDFINFRKEYPLAYKLADTYDDASFWKSLDFRKVPSLIVLKNAVLSDKILKLWMSFKARKEAERKVIIPEPEKKYEIGEKVGQDFIAKKKVGKSILDFCK